MARERWCHDRGYRDPPCRDRMDSECGYPRVCGVLGEASMGILSAAIMIIGISIVGVVIAWIAIVCISILWVVIVWIVGSVSFCIQHLDH